MDIQDREDAVRRAREAQSRSRFPNDERRQINQQERQPSAAHQAEKNTRQPGTAPAQRPPMQNTRYLSDAGVQRTGGSRPDNAHIHNPQQPEPAPDPPPAKAAPSPPASEPQEGLLDILLRDRERTLILTLLVILGSERGNNDLLYALMFLML